MGVGGVQVFKVLGAWVQTSSPSGIEVQTLVVCVVIIAIIVFAIVSVSTVSTTITIINPFVLLV